MFTDELLRNEEKLNTKVTDWLGNMESEYDKVDDDYKKDRQYFESFQKPDVIPKDKQYICENLITDLCFRLMGQMVGGKFQPFLKGGGVKALPIKELFLDILDKNKFKKKLIMSLCNYFYVEGFTGIKVAYNPFRLNEYGFLGFPELYILQPGAILLDSNSIDMYHDDDYIRAHKISMPIETASEKFSLYKDKIHAAYDDKREGNKTEDFVDLYEIVLKRTVFKEVDGKRQEVDEFYICKNINKTLMVKEKEESEFIEKSRFKRWNIIPVMHTPRINQALYPSGPVYRLRDTQDGLNIVTSVIEEAVKASIKSPIGISGAGQEDQAEVKKELTSPDGVAFLKSPQAKFNQFYSQPIARPLVEYRQMIRYRFDEISGKFAPDRGEVAGDLSGKAISLLQFKGIEPEYVSKAHLEMALVEMGLCVLDCIEDKMQHSFNMERKIKGNNKRIYFNTTLNNTDVKEDDEYNVIEDGVVNKLESTTFEGLDMEIEVEMNLIQKKEMEMNKAIISTKMGKFSDEDYLKALYPDTWKEKYENLLKQNKALQFMELVKQAPAPVVDKAMGEIENYIKIAEKLDKKSA